ncbi:MAG TPA: NUDIX hydrolase [Thermoanaerobaculia bacterium]|nr:NUDIX hydrolase [Thermoanaerobaculia bacterium]
MLTPLPAGSVIVLRDAPLEVLMLRRHAGASFMPNAWVFPGGTVDGDETPRQAAAREAHEEAGLVLDPESLVITSRWITPDGLPKRFDTWFFLASVPSDTAVAIDGREIDDWMWIAPADALTRRDLKVVLPTIKNLEAISGFDTVDALLESRRGMTIEPIEPVLVDGRPTLR